MLVDLLLDGSGSERQLSVLRLRSDRFDPRGLMDDAQQNPLGRIVCLRGALAHRLRRRGATRSPRTLAGRPLKVYESLDAVPRAGAAARGVPARLRPSHESRPRRSPAGSSASRSCSSSSAAMNGLGQGELRACARQRFCPGSNSRK